MVIAGFIVAVVAVGISMVSIFFAKRSSDAAKRSADEARMTRSDQLGPLISIAEVHPIA